MYYTENIFLILNKKNMRLLKRDLIDRIRSICNNGRDIFTLDNWDDMTFEQLVTVLAVLPTQVKVIDEMTRPRRANEQKGTCYMMEQLVWHLISVPNPTHPNTRRRITKRQVGLVIEAYKRVTGRHPSGVRMVRYDSFEGLGFLELGGLLFMTPYRIRIVMTTNNRLRTTYTFIDELRPNEPTTTTIQDTELTRFVVPRHVEVVEDADNGKNYRITRR